MATRRRYRRTGTTANAPRGTWADLMAKYPADVQVVARRLRAIVRDVLPRADETVWTGGWRVALYRERSEICGIGPMRQGYVNFYLTRGAELDDPAHLLEGTGRGIRHIKLRPGARIPTAALKRLIRDRKRLAAPPRWATKKK